MSATHRVNRIGAGGTLPVFLPKPKVVVERQCTECSTILSRYNKTEQCGLHTKRPVLAVIQ